MLAAVVRNGHALQHPGSGLVDSSMNSAGVPKADAFVVHTGLKQVVICIIYFYVLMCSCAHAHASGCGGACACVWKRLCVWLCARNHTRYMYIYQCLCTHVCVHLYKYIMCSIQCLSLRTVVVL